MESRDMKSMAESREEYDRTIQCAKELKKTAEEIRKLAQRLQVEQCVRPDILQTVHALFDVSENLRRLSWQVYEIQQKNLEHAGCREGVK